MSTFQIDSCVYHDAGASTAEEIALTTAAGLAALRALHDSGLAPDVAAAAIDFRWAVSDDQFTSIAKLRAARVVWARILGIAGAHDVVQRQNAVTSAAMLAARDPWVNLIRNCVAAFAGGVGGARSVVVLPHTLATGSVDEFARRIARNTGHLLRSESHIGFVTDPAGGSYFVEALTRDLAAAAWRRLREIEAAGGIADELASGRLARVLADTWSRSAADVASRRTPVTGVSEFPDRLRNERAVVAWTRPGGGLPQHRWGEDFERLRDRADAAGDPRVTLISLGPLARHGAREAFAANLFAAGGIGADTVAFATEADLGDVAPVVCLVAGDRDYADAAAAAAAARRRGAKRVWLAGKPGVEGEPPAADGYIYLGCDAIAVLEQTHEDLGVDR